MGDIKTTFSADGANLSQTLKGLCAQFNSFKVQIGIANAALDGIGKAFSAAEDVIGKFTGVLELGGTLNDLSAQTGQSVEDLVVLRQAFENTGLGADAVGQFTAKLQKSLSGVSEEGASTAMAFRMLGTSAAQLRNLSLIEQIDILTKGFAGIANASDRTAVAMAIFGKSGAKALSFFADTSAISQARKEVGGMAEVMGKSANSFDTISDQLKTASKKINEITAGILTGVAPEFEKITKSLAETDLTGLGRSIGNIASPAAAATKQIIDHKNQVVALIASYSVLKTAPIVFTGIANGLKTIRDLSSSVGNVSAEAFGKMKAALIQTGIGALVVTLGLVVSKIMDVRDAWKETEEFVKRTGKEVDQILAKSDKAKSKIGSKEEQSAELARLNEETKRIEAMRAELEKNKPSDSIWKLSNFNPFSATDPELEMYLKKQQEIRGWLDKIFAKKLQIALLSDDQIAKNNREAEDEAKKAEIADRGNGALRNFTKTQQELEEALNKAKLDGLSVDQKRAEILKEAGPGSTIESLQKEAAALEKALQAGDKGGFASMQDMALRYDVVSTAIREYIATNKDAKASEEARASAIGELKARLSEIKAATAAIGAHTEAEKIALKATQDLAKAEADYNEKLDKLRKGNKDVLDPASAAEARAVWEARKEQVAAETNEAQRQLGIKMAGQAIDIRENQLDAQHLDAAEQYKAIEESAFFTESEKARARIAAIDLENSHLESQIELLKERIALVLSEPGHEDEASRMQTQLKQLELNVAANKRLSGELQTQQTYAGQLKMQFKQMFDQTAFSAKNLATTLANSWSSAMDGISKGLTDVIFRVKSVTEAFREIAKTIVTDVVSSFIKMSLQWVAQKAFMFATGQAFAAKNVAAAEAEGSAITAAYAPAAATANIATLGGASIVGLATIGVAMAGIVALILGMKGFNEGGLIPGSPSSADNRLARVATGEYIVNAGAVSHYGASIFEALNNKALPRWSLNDLPIPSPSSAPAFATGGLVGPSEASGATGAKQETSVHVAVINTRQDMRDFMQKEGKKHVVDIVRGSAWQLGIS